MFDFRALRYFVRVAEMKSVSKAATSLYIAQPAISRQIKKLEDQIGVQLLIRSGRGIELTDAGTLLEVEAREILEKLSKIHNDVSACVDEVRGVVNLAVSPVAGRILVPPLIMQMSSSFPAVSLKILESFTSVIHDGLRSKRFDLGILHDPVDVHHLQTKTLLYELLYVIGPGSGETSVEPLSQEFDLGQLEKLPIILPAVPNQLRTVADTVAAKNKISFNIVAEIDSISIIKALVEKGFGYSLLGYGSVHDEVERGVLTATPLPEVQRKLVIAWNIEQRLTNAARETIGILHENASAAVRQGKWRGSL